MTYPTEPQTAIASRYGARAAGKPIGRTLHDYPLRERASQRFEREAVKILLIGNPSAVDQCVIELERKGFCDSYAWSQPLPIPQNGVVTQSNPGEIMRLYKRWYPPTGQRIPL